MTRSHAFSRALRQPHVITSSFDWFNVLSVSYVIGQSNYFGFGFTTLKRKPLYLLVVSCVFVQDGNNKTMAKIVDLDTQAQRFSEIWGWRLQIGDFFSADYTPVPFRYAWSKLTSGGENASIGGAVYQSVLSNIQWMDNSNRSPFIKQLQDTMKKDNIESDKLSIRFNLDLYGLLTEPKITGRVVGEGNGLYTRGITSNV